MHHSFTDALVLFFKVVVVSTIMLFSASIGEPPLPSELLGELKEAASTYYSLVGVVLFEFPLGFDIVDQATGIASGL